MPSQIVVPLDMSDVAEGALPLARAIARGSGTPIDLVTVIEASGEFMSWVRDSSAVQEMAERETFRREYLDQIAETIEGATVESVVLRGRPAQQIIEYTDQLENPVIVMTSHGRSGFQRLMVGSVLARVVHGSSCPVLVVRSSHPENPIPPLSEVKSIVVPLDGSEFAEHALNVVEELMGNGDVTYHLVRIPEMVTYPGTMYGAASYETVEIYLDAVEQEAEAYLKDMAAELEKRGHKVTWEVRQGLIADAIQAAVTKNDADMVAMSSHGRTGFRRVLMGSVAERVLNESPVPVLMVGPEDFDDEEQSEDQSSA